MRIGLITRCYEQGYQGGDRILDDRMKKFLSARVELQTLELDRDLSSAAIGRTLLRRSHPALETYSQVVNANRIATFAQSVDALVISHEALMQPFLQASITTPACVLMHNLVSKSDGDLGKRGWFRAGAGRVECQVLTRPRTTVMVLSHREHDALVNDGWDNVVACPPGIRSVYETRPERLHLDRIILNGTTAWGLKQRDFDRFLAESRPSEPRFAFGSEDDLRDDATLRVAVITDRFRSGFKLKSADLISQNTALISFIDLSADFPPDCAPRSCLRIIRETSEIENTIVAIRQNFGAIVEEITVLKQEMQKRMSWEVFGDTLLGALASAAGQSWGLMPERAE
ncbi:MAG: hypothetical protein V4747_04240 [Pseudomonadota bacterium]